MRWLVLWVNRPRDHEVRVGDLYEQVFTGDLDADYPGGTQWRRRRFSRLRAIWVRVVGVRR